MRNIIYIMLVIYLITSTSLAQESRTWTSKSGAKVEASFIKVIGTSVALKKSDGSMIQISRAGLSFVDNQYLDSLLANREPITVYVKPMDWDLMVLYSEVSAPANEAKGQNALEAKRRDSQGRRPGEHKGDRTIVKQNDTLKYKYQPIGDYKWHEDSTWRVFSTEEVTGEILGTGPYINDKRSTSGRYIFVKYQLENNSGIERNALVPFLYDANTNMFKTIDDMHFYMPDNCIDPRNDRLGNGLFRDYCTIYEVPLDAKDLRLKVFTYATYEFRGRYIPVSMNSVILNIRRKSNLERQEEQKQREQDLSNMFILSDISVAAFHATRPQGPTVLKALARLDDYFNYEFSTSSNPNVEKEYWSIRLVDADNNNIGNGYIRKNARGEALFSLLKDGISHPVIVRVRYPPNSQDSGIFILDDFKEDSETPDPE